MPYKFIYGVGLIFGTLLSLIFTICEYHEFRPTMFLTVIVFIINTLIINTIYHVLMTKGIRASLVTSLLWLCIYDTFILAWLNGLVMRFPLTIFLLLFIGVFCKDIMDSDPYEVVVYKEPKH